MIKDNSGPAFPTVDANRSEDYGTYGMTLRDYFAAKAMQGLVSSETYGSWQDFANASYAAADAMLEARHK